MLDMDHFKRFNDSHGHQAGDRLLQEAAAAWNAQARQGINLLARLGGEEFAALLPGADLGRPLAWWSPTSRGLMRPCTRRRSSVAIARRSPFPPVRRRV